jgi:outer membrane protein OmpA-like peptidoglycan-associated protein
MRKLFTPCLLLAFFFATALFSCVTPQKTLSHKQQLAILDSQLEQHSKKLKELDAKRKTKLEQNEMTDTASVRIQKYIGLATAEVDKLVAQNSILIGNTVVNKSDWNQLKKALTLSQKTTKLINDKVNFINDLINGNMVVKLDQDVLFEPGKYTVTPSVADAIGKFFEPAAKEIDIFTKKYPDFPLSLVITAKGYADGTSITEGTQLYKELVDGMRLSGRTPDDKELNKVLSDKRAKAVIELFEKYTRSRGGEPVKNILYLYEGKGNAPPNPKVTDYKIDDARRRIVLVFWSIFPD